MIYRLKHPSLYVRHLQRLQKDMATPIIVVAKLDEAAGYYLYPEEGCVWELPDGEEIEADRGVIVLDEELDDEEDTLTHEWRHHFQATQLGWDISNQVDYMAIAEETGSWEAALFEYYQQLHEWDAATFTYERLGRKTSCHSCYFMDILYTELFINDDDYDEEYDDETDSRDRNEVTAADCSEQYSGGDDFLHTDFD